MSEKVYFPFIGFRVPLGGESALELGHLLDLRPISSILTLQNGTGMDFTTFYNWILSYFFLSLAFASHLEANPHWNSDTFSFVFAFFASLFIPLIS